MYRWIYPLIFGPATPGPAAYAHYSIPGLYDRTREAIQGEPGVILRGAETQKRRLAHRLVV